MADESKWSPDAVIRVARELSSLLISILAAVFAGLALVQSDGAKDKATTAEVRSQENAGRIEANEKELTGLRPMMFGKGKE